MMRQVWRLLLLLGTLAALAGCALIGAEPAAPRRPAVADSGVLTEYRLPPDHGPWELTWDEPRNRIWFAEGNHTLQTLDRVAAIDAGTGVLREWGVPTASGSVHATYLDRNGDFWFTEHAGQKIGRLQPDSDTITEWTMPGMNFPHVIVVDDLDPGHVLVWFTEREADKITSFDPATGEFRRHAHPFTSAWPHGLIVAPDHSLWVVDNCDYRVGHLVPGVADDWTLWRSPSAGQCGAPRPGPLFGVLSNGDLWYSEPNNSNVLRLHPATNTFTIWRGPGAGSRQFTQIGLDPDGNVFFTEMRGDRVGRLEPNGATTPTVAAVAPFTTALPTPPAGQATPLSVVYTPIVTQLTPAERVVVGTRTGGIVEWRLGTGTPTPFTIGPARGWYGGGGFWVSEVNPNIVARFAPFTPTGLATLTPTTVPPSATSLPSHTPTTIPPSATGLPSHTPTTIPPSATTVPSGTPTAGPPSPTTVPTGVSTAILPSATRPATSPTRTPVPGTATGTPCALSFADVQPTDYFYTPVLYLACRGVISGYAGGTFRPYNNTTRAQMVKIVVLGFQTPISTPAADYTFADVPPGVPFFEVIETAAAGNIVSGYTCGGPGEPCDSRSRPYFRPNANVTRGQLAKIVVVAAAWSLVNPAGGSFADVLPNTAFYQVVETAYCHGIISGYGCGGPGEPCDAQQRPYFRQYNNSTRGQIAKIVYGALTGGSACAPLRAAP